MLQAKAEMICKLAQDDRLTDAQFRAAVVLLLKFSNSKTGQCYPSLRQWAEASCLGRSTVSEAATKLRDLGVISFEASNGGRNRRNCYRLNVRPAEAKRSPSRTPLNPYKYFNRETRKTATYSQPRFRPEPQINIPPAAVREAQIARLAHMGVRL
jgi:DNA-binding transcriptional MocR family regulator